MLTSFSAQASFIESTLGTAVVNDATASYYNPAALVLLKNSQIIPQETAVYSRTRFTGNSTFIATGNTESGYSTSNTPLYSSSLFVGVPVTSNIITGLAIVTNTADRNADESSILRYIQASNNVQDYDVVPALAIKINDCFSLGGGINFSKVNLDAKPVTGFPGTNVTDRQGENKSDGRGIGGNAGFLWRLTPTTLIGFNYRSMTTYHVSGRSIYNGQPAVISDDYHYNLSTPARSVLSINHFFTKKAGLIATIQRINWSTLTNMHVFGIANPLAPPNAINAIIPYYLRNTWVFTLGNQYRVTSNWIIRVAASYIQSPDNPHYQVGNGDSLVVGASTGYKINSLLTIDGSYAHAFMKNESVHISGNRFLINGVNQGWRNTVSLKLTFNV